MLLFHFYSDLATTLMTGNGMLKQEDGGQTVDGLQQTFATNVFGHFIMVNINSHFDE